MHEELLQQYNLRVLETQNVFVVQVKFMKYILVHFKKFCFADM